MQKVSRRISNSISIFPMSAPVKVRDTVRRSVTTEIAIEYVAISSVYNAHNKNGSVALTSAINSFHTLSMNNFQLVRQMANSLGTRTVTVFLQTKAKREREIKLPWYRIITITGALRNGWEYRGPRCMLGTAAFSENIKLFECETQAVSIFFLRFSIRF